MPLLAVSLKEILSPTGFSIDDVLKHGDLFVVSAVLAAGALGELLAAVSRGPRFYLVVLAGFFGLLTFGADTFAYMAATTARADEVAVISIWLFALTLLASASCVWTAAY